MKVKLAMMEKMKTISAITAIQQICRSTFVKTARLFKRKHCLRVCILDQLAHLDIIRIVQLQSCLIDIKH